MGKESEWLLAEKQKNEVSAENLEMIEKENEELGIEEEDIVIPETVSIQDPVRMYIKEIGKTPLLTSTEEVSLAKRIELGDREAKEKLTEANLTAFSGLKKRETS